MAIPKVTANRRSGLRIIGSRGRVEVKDAFLRYARWLRRHYSFPIRVPVYLFSTPTITTIDGSVASASFFCPFDPNENPHIRIATGDYDELLAETGRDNALASYLHSLSHELIHYWQWFETGETTERGVIVRARNMVDNYACDVDHP